MTRPNLETELLNTWNAEVAKLTPEERQLLAASTPADWIAAIDDLIRDPQFWQGLGVSFLDGIADGIDDYLNDRR